MLRQLLQFIARFVPRLGTEQVHVDYLLNLKVTGKVVDADGAPIPGAELVFLDTGLDRVRSQNPETYAETLDTSDADGKLSATFRYRWGELRNSPYGGGSGSFHLRIEHAGHRPVSVAYDTDTLPQQGQTYVVDLGTVTLPGA